MAVNNIGAYSMQTTRAGVIGHLLQTLPASASTTPGSGALAQFSTVAISAFGVQINSIYNALRQIENSEDRQSALQGMRNVFLDLIRNPTTDKWSSFVFTANQVTASNISALQEVFSPKADASTPAAAAAMPSTNDVNLYGRVMSSEFGASFAAAGLGIIRSDGMTSEKSAGFRELLNQVGNILDSTLSAEERATVGAALFDGLDKFSTLADKRAFIANFDFDALLNPPPESEAEGA